ncbi:single-stranded DNA-binding protein [Thermodesulfovibrio sp. TK110]
MYNKAILLGNLTKNPETRQTQSGTFVVVMPIATNTKYKQGDEIKEETLFIDVIVFGSQAETCAQYLSKGKTVLVEGRLRERKWEYEGQKRSKFEIIANTVKFVGGNGNREDKKEKHL